MIYNKTDLDNRLLQQQAEEAFKQNIISKGTYTSIVEKFKCGLYTPNLIIRFALGLVTIICIVFGSLLLGMMLFSIYTLLFFLLACGCYMVLEMLVQKKKHYNAGIDNVLMTNVILFFSLLFIDANSTYLDVYVSITILIASLYLCLRFTDGFMAAIAFISFFALVIFIIVHASSKGLLIIPFIVMTLSLIILITAQFSRNKPAFQYYKFCLQVVLILSLISLYTSGNFYAVIMFAEMYNMNLIQPGNEFIIGFFWLSTALIPLIYLWFGLKKKDMIFLRCGYILLAASIATVAYFYLPMPAEENMIAAGVIMLLISIIAIRYFKNAKHGFTSQSNSTLNKSISIAQTIISVQVAAHSATATHNTSSTQFGGGSSGGAGATGEW